MDSAALNTAYPGIADCLRDARRVVVFTGAGVSAESGIPTFRDTLTGLWARFDPQTLDTPEAFAADPALVWGWYEWRRARVRAARPNPAHLAIAAIERHVERYTLVTQNIDDLHERGGSTEAIHLHGSLFSPRCSGCGRAADPPDVAGQDVRNDHDMRGMQDTRDGCRVEPPRCECCGERIRPGVVWFGEPLPRQEFTSALEAASTCDVLLSIGTSGLVYPATEIPLTAAGHGASVLQVNPGSTPLDPIARFVVPDAAARVLPALVAAAWAA